MEGYYNYMGDIYNDYEEKYSGNSPTPPKKTYELYKGNVSNICKITQSTTTGVWSVKVAKPYAVKFTIKCNGYEPKVVEVGYDSELPIYVTMRKK